MRIKNNIKSAVYPNMEKEGLVNVLTVPVKFLISNLERALEVSLEQFCYSRYRQVSVCNTLKSTL